MAEPCRCTYSSSSESAGERPGAGKVVHGVGGRHTGCVCGGEAEGAVEWET